MKLSDRNLPYLTQTIAIDSVETEVTGRLLKSRYTQANLRALSVNKLIQTVLKKSIYFFLALVFTAVAIVALPISVVLVAVAFPVFTLFKAPQSLATF
ncbi:MAG: hypothetical protein F6K14_05225 [Symploca sp. SIO2C1]|nr:hypothetical protein [Symploca sp. SIO2C1]